MVAQGQIIVERAAIGIERLQLELIVAMRSRAVGHSTTRARLQTRRSHGRTGARLMRRLRPSIRSAISR
jgi:hypothetical protein